MNARAVLDLACRDQGTCRHLVATLAPDNEGAPRGLRLDLRRRGRKIQVRIEAESAATALSTSLAFLRDAALFQEVWLLSQPKQG